MTTTERPIIEVHGIAGHHVEDVAGGVILYQPDNGEGGAYVFVSSSGSPFVGGTLHEARMYAEKQQVRKPFSKELGQPNQDCGVQYLHCALCLAEKPDGQSPMEWARLNVAMTRSGIQVWCVRHDANVAHIDFMDHKLPADMTRTPLCKMGGEG